MNEIVVYSSIIGEYDQFIDHQFMYDKVDYVLFTDNKNIKSKKWKIIYVENKNNELTNSKYSRFFKWNPHLFFKEYKYSIWIDSSLEVMTLDFFERINVFISNNYKISMAKHPWRDNIYDEAKACIECKKDTEENISIILNIIKNNYINDHKLFAGTMIFREHNDNNIKIFDSETWDLLLRTTTRDQLIFPYIRQKHNIDIIDFNLGNDVSFVPQMIVYGTFWYGYHGRIDRDKFKYDFIYSLYNKYYKLLEMYNKSNNILIELKQKRNEIDCLKSSLSFRLGRFLTFIPRKIKYYLKSLEDISLGGGR